MRVLVVGSGSRGDVQPMLALAVALREAGHVPLLAATPTFASEADAFGIPFQPAGYDIRQLMEENLHRMDLRRPFKAVRLLNQFLLDELHAQMEAILPLARGMDAVVAGGVAMAARTAAEAARIPYRYVAYTPQTLPSAWHAPFVIRFTDLPRWLNRLCWAATRAFYDRLTLPTLNTWRQRVGVPPVSHSLHYFFPMERSLIASDPELLATPSDVTAPQTGSFVLPDERPLPPQVERFLAAGEPPIYLGFGSMPDPRPDDTTRLLVEAVRRAGCRAVLSSGWAKLGGGALGPDIEVVGPLSHGKLFPRMRAIVHHGGAGTTAAAARAGIPQVVVPHGFDQFMSARQVQHQGLGTSLPRRKLRAERLTQTLVQVLGDAVMAERAARAGERIRARQPLKAAIALLERDVHARLAA